MSRINNSALPGHVDALADWITDADACPTRPPRAPAIPPPRAPAIPPARPPGRPPAARPLEARLDPLPTHPRGVPLRSNQMWLTAQAVHGERLRVCVVRYVRASRDSGAPPLV